MLHLRAVLASSLLLSALGGCATVSMVEPKTAIAEVSLISESNELSRASKAYCENARRLSWSSGESDLGTLADLVTGRNTNANAYWRRIGAERAAPTATLARVKADSASATRGLNELSALAQKLLAAGRPARADVTEFERALIHARQARESFSDAIAEANRRLDGAPEYVAAKELEGLDRAISSARNAADDLAAARMAESVAGSPAGPPLGAGR